MPANIYDNEGYKTDKFGNPIQSEYLKGVWLCGYQLKVFLTKESELYRSTGLALSHNGINWFDRDHFHCCLNKEISQYSSTPVGAYEVRGSGIGTFPYERAWSKNYPVRYSIPKCPIFAGNPGSSEIYTNGTGTNYYSNNPSTGVFRNRIENPRFSDGDLIVGSSYFNNGIVGANWNGFGLSWKGSTEQYTDFATDVIGGASTANMYKYEPIGMGIYGQNQYFGCYANGYYNGIDSTLGTHSEVKNAEQYQRLEAGFGYFLFPSSMPRVVPIPSWFDGFLPSEVDELIENMYKIML